MISNSYVGEIVYRGCCTARIRQRPVENPTRRWHPKLRPVVTLRALMAEMGRILCPTFGPQLAASFI